MSGEPKPQELPEGEKKLSNSERKKLEKKAKIDAIKAAKAEAKGAEASNSNTTKEEETSPNCGDLPLIRSADKSVARQFTNIADLDESKENKEVLIRARLHNSRGKGNLAFVVLRQRSSTVQVVAVVNEHVNKTMIKFIASIPRESIVEVTGVVRKAEQKNETSQGTVELAVQKLFVVSRAISDLPLQVEDASRKQSVLEAQDKQIAEIDAEIKAAEAKEPKNAEEITKLQAKKAAAAKFAHVGMEARFDNRVIDLRTVANQGIFRIQSAVGGLWREFLTGRGFMEIHTPKIISAASEGGAQVFRLGYFDTNAYLAQSPQLYKQMAITGDCERVFEIAPVFRSENSNTARHLCEFMGLDLEMAFNDHYHEVLDLIDQLFIFMFEALETRFAKELSAVNSQHPFEPIKYERPTKRFVFSEAVKMLRELGYTIGDHEDMNTEQEKALGKHIKAKYGLDFYIIDKFPTSARPFYTMLDPHDANYTNAYDIFLRGEEISSGGQRIHDPAMLQKRAEEKGVDIKSIQAYIDAFKYGAPPHGGCGVGLERLVMLYLGLPNIRNSSMFPRDPRRLTP